MTSHLVGRHLGRIVLAVTMTVGLLSGPYECELTEPECRRAASQAEAVVWNAGYGQAEHHIVSIVRIRYSCPPGTYCPLIPWLEGGASVTFRYATGSTATAAVCVDETGCSRRDDGLVEFTLAEDH